MPAKHSPGKDNAPYSFPSRLSHQSSRSEPPAITFQRPRPPSKNVSCTLFTTGQQDEGLQISRLGAFCPPKIIGSEGQSRTDTGSPPPVFELVAVRTTSLHQTQYVPQSCLQRTNAFHQTSGDINPLGDVLGDGFRPHQSTRQGEIPHDEDFLTSVIQSGPY